MRFPLRAALIALILVAAASASPVIPAALGADPAADLLKFLPPDINTISVIRASDIMATPRAISGDWKTKQETAFLAGSAHIPPWVATLVRGTQMRSENGSNAFSVSLAPEPENISFDKLFPTQKVTADTVAGVKALRSARGYVAEVAPGVLGFMAPPDRQAFAYWLRDRRTNPQIQLPEYLRDVATRYKPHILFAVGLEDLFSPAAIGARIQSCKALAGKEADQQAVGSLLLRLKGMRLAILIDTDIHAALAFDFDGQTVPQASYLQPLLVELLDDAGARIDELEKAEVKIDATSVVLSAPLSDASLRRIMTLVLTPVSVQQEEYTPQQTSAPTPPAPSEAIATQKYFTLVNNTVRDLQILNHRAKEYNTTATWHDNYARKISEFPTTGVDPEVVQYAQRIAGDLRALAASLRGESVEINRLDNHVTYQWHVNTWTGPGGVWTPDGYHPAPWEVSSNLQEIRNAQDDAAAKSADQRDQIWDTMVSERDSIQGRMAAKYGVKFTL